MEKKEDNLAVGAKGGAIAFMLKIIATALGFINQIALARILGAGGVGEVLLAISVVRITALLAKFGLQEAMMKFVPIYVDQKDDARLRGTIYFALAFSLVTSLIFVCLVLLFSKYIAVTEGLLKLLPIIVLAIPAWTIKEVTGGVLVGFKDVMRAFIPESLVSPFFRLAIFLVLSLQGVSALYAVIAFASGEIIAMIFSIKFLLDRVRKINKVKRKFDKKKILDFAYTIIFTSMSVLLFYEADKWVLAKYTSPETVGIYGIASKLVLLAYFPMHAFASIIPPIISSIHASGNLKEFRKVVSESTRWILSMAMPVILVLAIEGGNILRYLYGPEFEAGYIVLLILVLGQMIKAGAGLIGVILQMAGQHKLYMKISIVWGIINIILNVLLIPQYGMIGAAIASAFCLSVIDIICIFIIKKKLSVLTLAKGLKFDIVFVSVVAGVYSFFVYNDVIFGPHLLLIVALMIYLGKSIYNHDIPWKLFISRNRRK